MPNKLDDLQSLLKQKDFTNRDVTFLFSELGKCIETDAVEYKTLKFYRDWLLHSQKNRFHLEMKQYIKEIFEHAVKHIKNPIQLQYSRKVSELVYFNELKKDIQQILSNKNLPKKILEEETWLNLIRVLVKLLENQPLVNPIQEVNSIVFSPSSEGAVILYINFANPVLDRKGTPQFYYKIGNYY